MICYGSLSHIPPFFTIEDVDIKLKNLASRNKDKMFKWETLAWISDMFNYVLQLEMPYN